MYVYGENIMQSEINLPSLASHVLGKLNCTFPEKLKIRISKIKSLIEDGKLSAKDIIDQTTAPICWHIIGRDKPFEVECIELNYHFKINFEMFKKSMNMSTKEIAVLKNRNIKTVKQEFDDSSPVDVLSIFIYPELESSKMVLKLEWPEVKRTTRWWRCHYEDMSQKVTIQDYVGLKELLMEEKFFEAEKVFSLFKKNGGFGDFSSYLVGETPALRKKRLDKKRKEHASSWDEYRLIDSGKLWKHNHWFTDGCLGAYPMRARGMILTEEFKPRNKSLYG